MLAMSTPILRARRSASGSRKRVSGHSVCVQGPKPGGTAYSAGISVLRRKNRRVRFLAENVILQAGRNILVEPWNFRSASTHHNHIRVQKIDNLRQTTREPVFESIERGKRGNFTCATSRDDLRALKRIAPCALIIRFQSRSGYPRFNAAIPPAVTRRAGILFGPHPRQCVVAPLARDSVRTAVDAAIDRNPAAATRAQYNRENATLSLPRAVGCFRNCQAVGVIRASHFASQRAAQILVEGCSDQPR